MTGAASIALAPKLPRLAEVTAATDAAAATTTVATAAATVSAVSTMSIFLPGYGPDQWSALRGCIVDSATTGPPETTVTIFCDDQSTQSCQLSNVLPFIFAEGPSTLRYAESASGIMANLSCQLNGTTAATCAGYTSSDNSIVDTASGVYTTAYVHSWSATLAATEVQWGVLTLSQQPTTTTAAGLVLSAASQARLPWVTLAVLASIACLGL